jgi:eukaryotic translation initiation factor 2C
VYIHMNRPERDWDDLTRRFISGFERSAGDCGMDMRHLRRDVQVLTIRDIDRELKGCKDMGANVVIVFLGGDDYNALKFASDKIALTTQCVRWKNVARTPSGYFSNLLLKINAKLGGTNHTLASRLADPSSAPQQFQQPPSSIAWIFDEPCMFMGVDVSHPEVGHEGASVCSVVASMDRSASQYCARVSFLTSREEIVGGGRLYESVKLMLAAFRKRNGTFPHYIIIYRDGVGDGSFDNVLRQEPVEIRNAIEESLAGAGIMDLQIRFTIVVCQKRHNARFAFHDGNEYINLCPGICIDAAVGPTAVVSTALNEFYLNSHVSIQGTSKPCRYSLIHDEIGIKVRLLKLCCWQRF